MKIEDIIKKIKKELETRFKSEYSGHDIYHLQRVLGLALNIQKKEGGDKLVIAVASFLHDIHRIIETETGKFCSPKDSLTVIRKILEKINLPEEKVKNILHCIEFHEEYGFSKKGKTVKDIETLILEDADNLDAIGAIGIARGFMYGGANNIPMWRPEISFRRKYFEESKNDVSEVHHFYSKLLKLKHNMNTKTGRKIAKKRHEFIERFLKEFFNEWKGRV